MEFDGTFLLTREVAPSRTTDRQVTDLSFRFCSVNPEGLLFRAEECASNPAHLKEKKGKGKTALTTLTSGGKSWSVFIHRGQLIVEIFLSNDVHDSLEWSLGENLGNDKWHDFRFVRRGPHVEFTLDDDQIIGILQCYRRKQRKSSVLVATYGVTCTAMNASIQSTRQYFIPFQRTWIFWKG